MHQGVVSRDCDDCIHVDIGAAADGILENPACKVKRNFDSLPESYSGDQSQPA